MSRVKVQSRLGDRALEVESEQVDFWTERGYRVVSESDAEPEAPKRRTRSRKADAEQD